MARPLKELGRLVIELDEAVTAGGCGQMIARRGDPAREEGRAAGPGDTCTDGHGQPVQARRGERRRGVGSAREECGTNPRLILSTCLEMPAGTEARERNVQWTSLGT